MNNPSSNFASSKFATKPSTLRSRPATEDGRVSLLPFLPESSVRSQKSTVSSPESELETRNSKLGTRNSELGTSNGTSASERVAAEPAAPPRLRKRSLTRVLVTTAILTATTFGLGMGALWGVYRLQHIVISDASVKGRVNKIGARLDGQVKSVDVVPAQRVRKGDVLLRMEDDFYQAAVRQAEAELQSTIKQYEAEKLFIDHERRRLAEEIERVGGLCRAADAEVEVATSEQAKWDREAERLKKLIAAGISSASETDSVTAQRDSAHAKLRAAQGKQAAAESDCRAAKLAMDALHVREASLEVLKANVERERQKLSAAQADLNATVIRAPDDGWVIERIVEPGGSAKVGEPLISLWLGAPWIEAWVNEKHLAKIKVGSHVDVTLTAYRGQKLRGHVEAIGVLADKELQATPVPSTLHALFTDNAMIPIRIAVASDRHRLQPGLSALVGIRNGTTNALSQKVAARVEKLLPAATALFGGGTPVDSEFENPVNLRTKK